MVEEIFLKNKHYISTKAAGALSGFTHDYVSRLTRQGKLKGQRFGCAWYVEEDSLRAFLLENNEEKARQLEKLAEERKREYLDSKHYDEVDEEISDEEGALKTEVVSYESPEIYVELKFPTDLFKQSVAFAISITLVFGSYFISDTQLGHIVKENVSSTAQNTVALVDKAVDGVLDSPRKIELALESLSGVLYEFPEVVKTASSDFFNFAYNLPTNIAESTISYSGTVGDVAMIFFSGGYKESIESFVSETSVGAKKLSYSSLELVSRGLNEYAALLSNVGGGIASAPESVRSFGGLISELGSYTKNQVTPQVSHSLSVASSRVFESMHIISGLGAQVAEFSTENIFSIAKNLFGNTRKALSRFFSNEEVPITTIEREKEEESVLSDIFGIAQAPSEPTQTPPTIERVIERVVVASSGGITEALLTERLDQLNNKLRAEIYDLT
ncbi:MAG: helix-turn-helix domain-containing protein, partial [Candidatus Pacebacteria bacterium]|nr:helix-turn-helix domain-containing protein [Candidatus Paceibacterota bacterium]